MRTISPISETRRLTPESFGLGFAGRPGMRVIAACFIFFGVFGRIFGIVRAPLAFCVAMFSHKCLKKWYPLRATHLIASIRHERFWIAAAYLRSESVARRSGFICDRRRPQESQAK